jgi:hypothetical protein
MKIGREMELKEAKEVAGYLVNKKINLRSLVKKHE